MLLRGPVGKMEWPRQVVPMSRLYCKETVKSS